MVCIRCKKRPAIIFIQRMENGQMKQEGYCLHCARELHIKPVEDMMKQLGMSEQDMDSMEDRMNSMLEEMGPEAMSNPFAALMNMDKDDDGDDGFTPGGNATFPSRSPGRRFRQCSAGSTSERVSSAWWSIVKSCADLPTWATSRRSP